MEPLSNIRTIVGIAQDILAVLETASRSKRRCGRVAGRVRRVKDILRELDDDGTATDDAAMRSLLETLEEALNSALRQVRRCQRIGFLRGLVLAGGRMADPPDDVESEIDRCVQDLTVACYVRIARLEKALRQQNVTASTDGGGGKSASKEKVTLDGVPDEKAGEEDEENATAAEKATVIGVPVCTLAAGTRKQDHEIVPVPPSSYGNGYDYWRFSHGQGTCGCCHDYASGPSDAASYYPQTPYLSMFSDDNPDACIII
ncbi:hypothetical protein HU200_062719 [Digitaria exilis]|uniref:Mixed lineage kinase domain-containing protein n=1 Tax=Digitaria exilis TaxID=1010633 RepID=A0A835DWY8_9POAL|nr:hypothetical protein HU200_062719 [Digitaria exilis]